MPKKKDTTIPLTEARKRLFELAEAVQKPDSRYTFTQHGRRKAVMMSAEEFDSWQETIEVMHQFPNLEQDSQKAWQEFERGEAISFEDVLKGDSYVSRRRLKKSKQATRKN